MMAKLLKLSEKKRLMIIILWCVSQQLTNYYLISNFKSLTLDRNRNPVLKIKDFIDNKTLNLNFVPVEKSLLGLLAKMKV